MASDVTVPFGGTPNPDGLVVTPAAPTDENDTDPMLRDADGGVAEGAVGEEPALPRPHAVAIKHMIMRTTAGHLVVWATLVKCIQVLRRGSPAEQCGYQR
jgi:hypothetical protein